MTDKKYKTGAAKVFSIATNGYRFYYRDCLQSHHAYARRNGFDYSVICGPRGLSAAESAWLKLPLIRLALDRSYEWVMYVDADCEIRDTCPDFRTVFSPEKLIYMAQGHSGRLNSGVIIARASTATQVFLDLIVANCEVAIPEEDRAPYENGHVIHFAKSSPLLEIIDRQWNQTVAPAETDYIRHYTGPMRGADPPRSVWARVLRKLAPYVAKLSARARAPDHGDLARRIEQLTAKIAEDW
jgi:hypothetical protein